MSKSCITCKFYRVKPKEEPCVRCNVNAGMDKPEWKFDGLTPEVPKVEQNKK